MNIPTRNKVASLATDVKTQLWGDKDEFRKLKTTTTISVNLVICYISAPLPKVLPADHKSPPFLVNSSVIECMQQEYAVPFKRLPIARGTSLPTVYLCVR